MKLRNIKNMQIGRTAGVHIVVACDLRRGIGKDGKLPWPVLKEDFARFKSLTMEKPCILGRKTWESIGRPLPGRHLIVLSGRDHAELKLPVGVEHAIDFQHALFLARQWGKEVCIIGGEEVYKDFLSIAERIYLTVVHETYDCDTFFSFGMEWVPSPARPAPEFQLPYARALDWKEHSREDVMGVSGIRMSFVELRRTLSLTIGVVRRIP